MRLVGSLNHFEEGLVKRVELATQVSVYHVNVNKIELTAGSNIL